MSKEKVKPVVKKNLTSEERCKRIRTMYDCLNNLTDATSEGASRDSIAKFIKKQQGYIERLLIREQKYSSELTTYREALKEIIQECVNWTIPNAEKANNSEYDYYVEIEDLKALIEKAKQLLK